MKLWETIRQKTKSLFVRLLASFLAVILILAAFNFFSFLYLKEKLFDEIINYNRLNIQHTVESYENHFQLITTMLIGLNQSDKWVTNLNILRDVKAKNGYDKIDEVKSELKLLYTNPFLHFENIVLHFRKDAYVLEKEGTSSSADMFTKFYASPEYPPEFWMDRFNGNAVFHVLPAARFAEKTMNLEKSRGLLLPVIIKTTPYNDMYFIVLLDAAKLFQSYYYNTGHGFYIMDDGGRAIYQSQSGIRPEPLPVSGEDHSYFRKDGHYYFYQQGAGTGFTYVSMVPIKSIASQLLRLNMILISLLAVTIAISVVISVLFSVRLNTPVRRLLESIQRQKPESAPLPRSTIREFELIGDRMSNMLMENVNINHDLAKKNSLLRNYAFSNKLKNIHMNLAELKELAHTDKPLRFLLYRVTFKEKDSGIGADRKTYFIREFISSFWQQARQEAVTFQTEEDLVLTLLFDEESEGSVLTALEQLKQVLDVDRDLVFLTVAVSPLYPAAPDFTKAYAQVYELLKQRELIDGTQIIRSAGHAANKFHFAVMKEEEFHTRFMTGSEETVIGWIDRCLEEMEENGAYVEQYWHFAEEVLNQLDKSLIRLNLTVPSGEDHRPNLDAVKEYYSVEQYREWFRLLLEPSLRLIRRKTEEKDPVISFVTDYMESHLHEDITLDLLADKLNLTPGYLSTFYKDKTGNNFSDALNSLRVQHAKRMLQNHEWRIQDVAARVGYQNVNSFIRMFKRYSGVTPGEYRKMYASHAGLEDR